MATKAELMHYRLQAWIRENNSSELEYLGIRSDILGVNQHYYRIGEHEVSVEMIEDLEMVEEYEE